MQTVSMAVLLVAIILAGGNTASAQFTFMGDYDKTFAAPLGYYVDPQDPDPTIDEHATAFYTGEYASDGSIIAGGRLLTTSNTVDFYVRKFTPTGAADTSFGTGGFVRTNFHSRFDGVPGYDVPNVLKVQPDGKIVFAGQCPTLAPNPSSSAFGVDGCIIRYNANGTLDQTFGGATILYTSQSTTQTFATTLDPGKAIFQTGLISNGQSFGTSGTFHDMAIQPDGKIVLVGETLNYANFFAAQGIGAIVVRLNANGSLDSTFGTNGIARWTAPEVPANCFAPRRFYGVRLQPDGRIIAVGQDGTNRSDCFQDTRFVVTRWTANGQLETVRHLDNNTTYTFNRAEGASTVLFTRDGSKILVSGAYKNISGPSPPNLLTMVRFNSSDLSVDTTFGSGGIRQHSGGCGSVSCGFFSGGRLQIKAIQPDGKILAIDGATSGGNVVRYNPDGTLDQSFGNGFNGAGGMLGRLRVLVTNYNGFSAPLEAGQILVRPNGRINLLGYSAAHAGLSILRAVVSQQNTVFENGTYSDFTNDGKTDIGVFRDGLWYYLNSANNQFNGVAFGLTGDKPVPADYDGDGKTDVAVYRDGVWYLQQSTRGFSAVSFGLPGDLPRPGDFDGDGLADISVFRPSNGSWYRINSSTGQFAAIQFGQNGDVPMLGDYDGDGKTDFVVYRPSNGYWYVYQSSDDKVEFYAFGASGDIPVHGDFNGDSRSDLAVYRPSNATWYIARPTGIPAQNFDAVQFGLSTDVPVSADYDNDGKTDVAVYRNGTWWILRSGNNQVTATQFGISSDKPIPAAYQP